MAVNVSEETERRIERLVATGRFESPEQAVDAAVRIVEEKLGTSLEAFDRFLSGLPEHARDALSSSVNTAAKDLDAGRFVDGDTAMARARAIVAAKSQSRG